MHGWVDAGGIPHPIAWECSQKMATIKTRAPATIRTLLELTSTPRTFIPEKKHLYDIKTTMRHPKTAAFR